MEGGVERALRNLQRVVRKLLYAFGNRPAVLRLQRERPEDQEIERSLRKRESVGGQLLPLPFYINATPLEAQGEYVRPVHLLRERSTVVVPLTVSIFDFGWYISDASMMIFSGLTPVIL